MALYNASIRNNDASYFSANFKRLISLSVDLALEIWIRVYVLLSILIFQAHFGRKIGLNATQVPMGPGPQNPMKNFPSG